MTAWTRSRNIAVILILVACGAAGYYLFAGRGPGKVHTHTDPAPSQTNNSAAPQAVHFAKAVDVKRQPQVDAAEKPATPAPPSLDGRTMVNCHRAFPPGLPKGVATGSNPEIRPEGASASS